MDKEGPITRTPDEIVARIKALNSEDLFGVERSRLLEALPYEHAKQFLRDDAPHTAETWEAERVKDRKAVIAQIRGYLTFAWGKANECRGLSAQRSMSHFKGLLWLLGDQEELREWIGSPDTYAFYGKPALVKLSELVGFNWLEADNDEWRNAEGEDAITADEALGRA